MAVTGILNPDTWYSVSRGRVPGSLRIKAHDNQDNATAYAKEIFGKYLVDELGYRKRSLTGRVSIGKGLYRAYSNQQWEIYTEIDAVTSQSFFRGERTTDELSRDKPNADLALTPRRYGPFFEDTATDIKARLENAGSNTAWTVKVYADNGGDTVDLPEGYTYNHYCIVGGRRYPGNGYYHNPETPNEFTYNGIDATIGGTFFVVVLGYDRIDNEYFDINGEYGAYNRQALREVDTREVYNVIEIPFNTLQGTTGYGWLKFGGYLGFVTPFYRYAATVVNPSDNNPYDWARYTVTEAVKPYDGLAAVIGVYAETRVYSYGNQVPAVVELEHYWLPGAYDTEKPYHDLIDEGGFSTLPLPANQYRYETVVRTRYALGTPYFEEGIWKYPAIHDVETFGGFSLRRADTATDRAIRVSDKVKPKHRRGIEIPGLPQSRLVIEHTNTGISAFIETEGVAGNPFGGEDLTQFGVSFGLSLSGTTPKLGFSPVASIWGVSPMSAVGAVSGVASSVKTAVTGGIKSADDAIRAAEGINKAMETARKSFEGLYGSKPSHQGRIDR